MKLYSKVVDKINFIMSIIVRIMLAVLAIVVFAQVVFRFLIHSPLTWSDEFVKYTMVWMVFLATGLAIQKGSLLGIEAVKNKVPKIVQDVFALITYVFLLLFFIMLLYYGMQMVQLTGNQGSATLPIKMSLVYACVPVGMVFAILNLIDVALKYFFDKEDKNTGKTEEEIEQEELKRMIEEG